MERWWGHVWGGEEGEAAGATVRLTHTHSARLANRGHPLSGLGRGHRPGTAAPKGKAKGATSVAAGAWQSGEGSARARQTWTESRLASKGPGHFERQGDAQRWRLESRCSQGTGAYGRHGSGAREKRAGDREALRVCVVVFCRGGKADHTSEAASSLRKTCKNTCCLLSGSPEQTDLQ